MKINIIIPIYIFVIFSTLSGQAQVCIGNITLETQSDVDNFNIDYPSCTELEGNLLITGSDITDISPLAQLDKVIGNFEIINCQNLLSINDTQLNVIGNVRIIENESLNEINGFNSTDSLKTLNIFKNTALSIVAGFDGLRVVSDSLYIDSNNGLQSIPYFNNVDFIGRLEIDQNSILDSVIGFNNLDSINLLSIYNIPIIIGFNSLIIGGTMSFTNPPMGIKRIEGFNNVERLAGGLTLGGITQEAPIEIFNKVKTIAANLTIGVQGGEFNSLLQLEEVQSNHINILASNFQNLDFLSNMKRMGGFKPFIRIDDCPNLTDISGLDGIDPETVNWFRIRRNENLTVCHSNLICAVLERGDNDPPSVLIDNGPGCNSTEEILAQCTDKPDDPEVDPTLCPIASRPGMQIDRISDDRYDIMYNYGIKRMYLSGIAYSDLLALIEYHKIEKDLLFDFSTFTLERYCKQAEDILRGVNYSMLVTDDPILQDIVNRVMSEIDFFSNFVLTIDEGECVKL